MAILEQKLVLLEAQACGLPILSYDCPYGPRNIVIEKTGVLIDMNNKEKFAQTIITLMANQTHLKSLGENAKLNADNYSIDKVMLKWTQMFDELITVKL